jgi:hypothetical protein
MRWPAPSAFARVPFPVQFEFRHEIDAPLDALESALMSPELGPLLGDKVDFLESVDAREHDVESDEFRRIWHFQAKAPLKILRGYNVTRDMMMWDEHCTYRRQNHVGAWHVVPRAGIDPDANWRNRFSAKGTYQLDPIEDGRTQRTVNGDISVGLKLIGRVVERLAVAELRRAYDAEADALRSLCELT